MKCSRPLQVLLLILAVCSCAKNGIANTNGSKGNPNIIVILADDMGYGDIAAYNSGSKIPTPNLDLMAKQGVRFTDAHSPSAVCTPTRYSLLTGRYAWRSSLKSGVLWGYSPLLIETGRETIPSMLKKQGYHTAGIGKWHLGMGNSEADYYEESTTNGKNSGDDFGRLSPGPNEVGFDYFFGIPASLDMKPYIYVENGKPYSELTGKLVEASYQRRYGGNGFWRKGQIAENFSHQKVLSTITEKAVDYIKSRKKNDEGSPFFLYFALTAPHTPWLPEEKFVGKSEAGYYGDFVVQVDDVVGQIKKAVDDSGFTDNTLIVYASDNGAHWLPRDIEKYKHLANGSLRGQKADIHEGGHRVPMIVSWPVSIPSGYVSNYPTTLADLMATFAAVTGAKLEADDAPDSFNMLQILKEKSNEHMTRPPLIHHSLDGMFAIRDGDWKLIEGIGSGGFTAPIRENIGKGAIAVQLYNLKQDPAETKNQANRYPDVVERLRAKLSAIRDNGSSFLP